MRNVPASIINNLAGAREVGARFTFRDRRLIFSVFNPTENNRPSVDSNGQTDSAVFGTGILRVAKAATGNLWYQYVDDLTADPWPNWVDSGITLSATSSPAVEGGRIWYQDSLGDLYYVDFDGATLGTPVLLLNSDTSWHYSFAPVAADACYIHWFPYASTFETNYGQLGLMDAGGNWVHQWDGAIYGDKDDVYRFDAVRINGVDHVYTVDRALGRVLVTKVQSGVYSDLKYLIPIDVVDNTSAFNLGGVSVIDGKAFVAGRLTRDQNISMDIYMMGPDNYTLGRDMFIASDQEFSGDGNGKLHLIGDTLYFVGYNNEGYAKAPATTLVGYDNPSQKLTTQDLHDFNAQFARSQSSRLSGRLRSDLEHAAIRRNSELEVEAGVGDGENPLEFVKLATYNVDIMAHADHADGHTYEIQARSKAGKALSNWTSDAFYDYWSQAKQASDPAELSELVRTGGQWSQDDADPDTPLQLDQLNVDGVLYTVARAARGGMMRAKFRYDSGSADPLYGVGLNYYRETRYEAAERLDMEATEVSEDEYGHHAVLALYGTDVHAGGTGVALYRWEPSGMTLLGSAPLTIPADTWHWLQLSFQEGRLRVLYREDGSANWSEVASILYQTDATLPGPWADDDRGRGVLYVRNKTPYANTPGFSTRAQVIPVDDTSPFTTPDTVIVDEEQITVSETSPDPGILGPFTVAEGYTHRAAQHSNDQWTEILLYSHAWDTGDPTDYPVGGNSYVFAGQAIERPFGYIRFDHARVPIQKIGNPGTLYAHVVTDDFDNVNDPIWSARLMTAQVDASEVSTSPGYVDFDFTATTPEPDRWITPAMDEHLWLYISTVPPGVSRSGMGSYIDGSNYYRVQLNGNFANALGIFLLYSTGNYWDRWRDVGSGDVIMPFEMYGIGNDGEGHEVYLEGATPPVSPDIYRNMAMVVQDGPGEGGVFRITQYDHQAPDQWQPSQTYNEPDTWQDHIGEVGHGSFATADLSRVFVDTRPYSLSPGSQVMFYPALVVDQRASDGGDATPHGEGIVSSHEEVAVATDQADFYSIDMDMRYEDMGRELAAKAGITVFDAEKVLEGNQVFSGPGWNAPVWLSGRRNLIVKFDAPTLDAGEEVGVIFRAPTNPADHTTLTEGYMVTLDSNDDLNFWKASGGGWSVIETIPVGFTPAGQITVSVQQEHISIWIADRFVHSFNDVEYTDGAYCGLIANGALTVNVDWSNLDTRKDNFVMDMGHRGNQLMKNLIGPRRMFWMDRPDGSIYMARTKINGSAEYTVPDLVFEDTDTQYDAEQLTRVRAEGAEIAETVDWQRLRDEGNLFVLVNATEANDAWETKREADLVMAEAAANTQLKSPAAAIDPRVEPNDIISVTVKDGAVDLVVDAVMFQLYQSEEEAAFDMQIEGRYAGSA